MTKWESLAPGRQSPLAAWCHFKMNPPFEEEEDDVEGEEGGALDHVAGLDGLIARIVIGRAVQKEVVLLKEANEAMIQGEERENAAADEMQAVEEQLDERNGHMPAGMRPQSHVWHTARALPCAA